MTAKANELYGTMRVIGTDQGAGRRYRCWCGWKGWTVWGRARKHAAQCALAWLEIPEPTWRKDERGREAEACCPANGCDWSSEHLGEWQRWTPSALRARIEEHYVKTHASTEEATS